MDNEFILQDRIQKIQQIVGKYGEDNFYISYSGGLDSNVLSTLVDLALPNNKISRVYSNTGIEYKMIVDFVKAKAAIDDRFIIITPKLPIRKMLEEEGYPFKSKSHSKNVAMYQKSGLKNKVIRVYLDMELTLKNQKCYRPCPKILRYQFTPENTLKISDKCCVELKEEPLKMYEKEMGKKYSMIGIVREEGGRRYKSNCLVFKSGKFQAFQPLVVVTKEWEKWFIDRYNIDLPELYYPPYNFIRTGCKGCPFAINLQEELDTLKELLPNEYKQCEIIWKPVYDEYRRLGYRLKPLDLEQITFDDIEV